MSEESTLRFRGLCRYIHRLSKASKAGMRAALANCPKRHFPMLEGLQGCIRLHGQDGAALQAAQGSGGHGAGSAHLGLTAALGTGLQKPIIIKR